MSYERPFHLSYYFTKTFSLTRYISLVRLCIVLSFSKLSKGILLANEEIGKIE